MPRFSQGHPTSRKSSGWSSTATSRRSTATWNGASDATVPTSSPPRSSASRSSNACVSAPCTSALPWLYGLATNLMLKRWRGETRHARAVARLEVVSQNGHGDELEASDNRVTAAAAREQLLDALAQLPAADRDVVVLVAWEELTYEEVAAALDIPLGTVRSRLNRARRTLPRTPPRLRE